MIDKFRAKGILSRIDYSKLIHYKSYKSGDAIKHEYRIPNERENYNLYLTISDKSNIISIHGNLRKFWYGKRNVFNDLTYRSYIECLKFIAKQLRADLFELLQFRLGGIEIGMNVRLPKQYAKILESMKSFPKRDRVSYKGETILFPGIKSEIMVYDKLKETVEKTIKKSRLRDKLLENNFCLRFEIDIRSKSGLKIKNELRSFMTVKDNWNKIIDYILEQFFLIEIVDEFSRVKDIESNNLTLIPLKRLFIFFAMDNLGIDETYRIINSLSGRKKSEYRPKFRKIYREFRSDENPCIKTIVSNKMVQRAKELKKT